MDKYNYFGFPDSKYYVKNSFIIDIFEGSQSKKIFAICDSDGVYKFFEFRTNVWRKCNWISYHSAKKIGSFEFNCGMLKDDEYFNPANPIMPGASKILPNMKKYFIEGMIMLNQIYFILVLFRNSQYIGNLNPLQD